MCASGADHAFIGGKPAEPAAAVAEAARLLTASRCPVIAGLGTDIAGARAAILLAERLGAIVDHAHSDTLLRDVDVMRGAGIMITTPNEARLRGDVLLLVGSGLIEAWPELAGRLLTRASPEGGRKRRVLWLCPGQDMKRLAAEHADIQTIGRDSRQLPLVLAALRARIAGRVVADASIATRLVNLVVPELKSARFGVAVWSAAALDPLAIEMLCGIIRDLNAATRFTGLPLAPADNAMGVLQVCGWMTGFPMRTGFGRGYPEHDPWRFDARRLVESGEADCAVWISAYRAAAPLWQGDLPVIALTGDAAFRKTPHVHFAVGRPATDHDCVEHFPQTGTLAAATASHRSNAASVAHVLSGICAALPGGPPC